MKYIVLSFDDGLLDFRENALPILNKYGFKATLNIISGFSDKTVETRYKCLSVDDIKHLYANGFDIANHTDSHMKHGSYDELSLCNKKINEWLSINNILGIAMPKYAKPSDDALRYINENNPPYVTWYMKTKCGLGIFLRRIRYKLLYSFSRSDCNYHSYLNQLSMYKKGKASLFTRVEAGKNVNPKVIYESFKTIKDGYCVTVCLHSIIDNPDESYYPKGAWTLEQFDTFCSLLSSDKQLKVITQIEACER